MSQMQNKTSKNLLENEGPDFHVKKFDQEKCQTVVERIHSCKLCSPL